MKTIQSKLCSIASIVLATTTLTAHAQWIQNVGTGPFDYANTANWNGGVINNQFRTNITTGVTITFGAPITLSSQMLLGWSNNAVVTFASSSSTPQTIKFSPNGGIAVTNSLGGTVNIGGTNLSNNPLILDLNGATNCTVGGVPGTSGTVNTFMNVNAQIIDSVGGNNALKVSGDRTFTALLNTNNSFVGPLSFYSLRGGSFPSIKPIGGGPSALGAPTDSTNGTITVADIGSNGSLRYTGGGDTSDRPFVFNVTFSNAVANAYQFANAGTGLLKLTGQMSFPTNSTNGSQFIISATNAPIELDGYIHGSGNSNGTFTFLCFAGGPGNVASNRITLTGLTNDFRDFIISNVVLIYNNMAAAGVPSAIGAGTNVVVSGGSQGFGSWQPSAGQGSSLQYVGATNATFTRNIVLTGPSFYYALDNAGTNTVLTWSNNISWGLGTNTNVTAFNPRFLYINPNIASTNVVYSYIPDPGFLAGSTPISITLGVGNPYGITVNNGGLVQLLNPTNTFAGGVMVAYSRTLQAAALSDIGQPSSIGTGTNGSLLTENAVAVQLNGINLGSPDSSRGGTFSYIGTTNASSNHKITIFGPTFSTAVVELCGLRNDSPNNSSLHMTDTGSWLLQPQGAAGGTNAYEAVLGGAAKTTNTLDSIIGDMPNNANVATPNSGNVLVNGSAWRLTANQTYSGTTMVANATMLVNGSLAAGLGATVSAGGVLGGTGTINENVNVLTNGTVTAGDGGIGTLTINGNLTNFGTLFMKLDASANTNDVLALGANTLAYGGTLAVSNTAGMLSTNNSFALFSAGAYVGAISSISPATPGAGLAWDTTSLTNNGVLKIVTGGPVPPPQVTSNSLLANGTFKLTFSGTAGAGYRVWANTNVDQKPITNFWTILTSNTFGAGSVTYTDLLATNFPSRFYLITTP